MHDRRPIVQEIRFSGEQILTEDVTDDQIKRAVHDKRNKTVIIHKPGSIITYKDGTQYQVAGDGSFRRLTPKR